MTLRMHRLLHAGYLLECESVRLLLDPIFETPFSVNCHPWPAVRFEPTAIRDLQVDAVFISHYHDDHCSLASLDLLPRDTPIHLFCRDTHLHDMIRSLGFRSVSELQPGTGVITGPFVITPVKALEEDVDCMLRIEVAGLNILNVVDAWVADDTLAWLVTQAPWDMVIWPFQTLRECAVLSPSRSGPTDGSLPSEWLEQLMQLNPAVVIPGACQFIHEEWSWWRWAYFPLTRTRFMNDVQQVLPNARLLDLPPGQGIALQAMAPAGTGTGVPDATPLLQALDALDWVIPEGPQDVDYHHDPKGNVPPTHEIAARFRPLDKATRGRLLDWCRDTLPARYASLCCGEDWFDEPRRWCLALWHADGSADLVCHIIEGTSMKGLSLTRLPAGTDPALVGAGADWYTELPAARLAGAVWAGETLSSLYIRINDRPMPPATEAALETLDILEDPLLRSLYENDPFCYQRAQLARLLSRQS